LRRERRYFIIAMRGKNLENPIEKITKRSGRDFDQNREPPVTSMNAFETTNQVGAYNMDETKGSGKFCQEG